MDEYKAPASADPEKQEGADGIPTPWHASVWFNLLMICLSMCFCGLTAFYPLISLGKNKRITEKQKKFLVIVGITTGILTIISNIVFTTLSFYGFSGLVKKIFPY